MKNNKVEKTDSLGPVLKGFDAVLCYSHEIDDSVGIITVTRHPFREVMNELVGKALKNFCPEKTEKCGDEDFCVERSCRYSRFIWERVMMKVHDGFDQELSSFFKTEVRRLDEQIP
ncbi:MAG: hypothetical protein NT118_13825, partial [Lentisphaerae bacterium]|nr:hypothetical protein [Lentisphaerota bacterium]